MPASTSPVPAVARAALPVELITSGWPGVAITVPEPLSTTVQKKRSLNCRAAASRSCCTRAAVVPSRRAASNGWGVSTVCACRVARARSRACSWVSFAMAFRASASITAWVAIDKTLASAWRTASPPPQPHTIVMALKSSASTLRSISSGRCGSTAIAPPSSRATNTRPAPECSAADAASKAAPVMPGAPPMTATSP